MLWLVAFIYLGLLVLFLWLAGLICPNKDYYP